MFPKKQRTTSILMLLILLLSSCQPIQSPTPTPPEPSPTLTNTTQPTKINTPTIQVTKTPSVTPSPDPTKVDIRMMGTPLPTNLAIINTKNIRQIQHLASWGTGSPNKIHLSSDGQILAVGTSNGAHFYDSLGLYELAFRETPHSVMSFAFSTDHKFVAVGQFGGVINIFDRYGFTPILQLDAPNLTLHDTYEFDLFFSPDNAKLISIIRTDEKIFINHWQTSNWQPADAFTINNGYVSYINPDVGIIGVIKQGELVLQSMLISQDFKSLPVPESPSKDYWLQLVENKGTISACGNGEDLMINNGSSIRRWNIPSGKISYELTEYPISLPGPCQKLADSCLNQNGDPSWVYPAWICEEDTIPTIETIALTPDGLMLLISRNDNNVEFRRAFDGLIAWEIETKYTQVRFSPGSEFFFGLQEDGLIEKRSTENGVLLGAIDQHPGRMYDIAFSPDGDDIAGGINTGWTQIFNTSDGKIVGVLAGSASILEYSPDGALLAAGLLDGRIRIFDLATGQYFDLSGHQDAIADLAFSSDGKNLLAGSTDCTISLWDLVDGARTKSILPDKETPFMIKGVEFSPIEENQYLVINHESLFIVSEEIKTPLLPSILLSDLALSQNKLTMAVTGESTHLFRVIDDNAFSESINLSTQGRVLALNGDGSLLILGTRDTLEFWSVDKAEKLQSLPSRDPGLPGNQPINLEISSDDTLIGVGYQNGLIGIFGIPGN